MKLSYIDIDDPYDAIEEIEKKVGDNYKIIGVTGSPAFGGLGQSYRLWYVWGNNAEKNN